MSLQGFFRRSLTRKDQYKCSGSKNCEILPGKRTSCPYCRFQKCMSVGMSKDGEILSPHFDSLKENMKFFSHTHTSTHRHRHTSQHTHTDRHTHMHTHTHTYKAHNLLLHVFWVTKLTVPRKSEAISRLAWTNKRKVCHQMVCIHVHGLISPFVLQP